MSLHVLQLPGQAIDQVGHFQWSRQSFCALFLGWEISLFASLQGPVSPFSLHRVWYLQKSLVLFV